MVLAVYLIAGIVGLGLVLFSALGGLFGHGHDGADHGVDHSHDHDLAHHSDHHGVMEGASGFWLIFTNLRFWTYFAAGFGLLGSGMTILKTAPGPIVLTAAIVTGFLAGGLASFLVAALRKGENTRGVKSSDFMGAEGKLLVGIGPGQPGKVRLMIEQQYVDVLVSSANGESLSAQEEVVVVGVDGGLFQVSPKDQLWSSSE